MGSFLELYEPTILACGLIGALLLIQLLIADVFSIASRHPPGTPIEPNHENPLFRAHRAYANTNESISAFVLLVLFSLAMSAPAGWLNGLSWVYAVGRLGHMLCYYANIKTLRSVFFGVSFIALLGMAGLGVYAWWI